MRRHHALAATCCATLLLLAPASAHAQDSSGTKGQFVLGAGLAPAQGYGSAGNLLAGYEWRRPGARTALRLAADFLSNQSGAYPINFTIDGAPDQRVSTLTRELTVGLTGSYALRTGRVQPYLLSGVALNRQWVRDDLTAGLTPDAPGYGPGVYRRQYMAVGLQGGIGLSVRVRQASVFTELRSFAPIFSERRHRSGNSLTLGLRF